MHEGPAWNGATCKFAQTAVILHCSCHVNVCAECKVVK